MHLEVEQKFRVVAAAAQQSFDRLGIQLSPPVCQIDRYFNHPQRDFRVTDEALRIRSVGDSNLVTYKGPRLDATTKTRHELELPLAPGVEVAEHYVALLLALGFQPAGTVSKSRRNGVTSHDGQRVQVAFDEVDGLGSYVELEIEVAGMDFRHAKSALESLANLLDFQAAERRSYLELLQL